VVCYLMVVFSNINQLVEWFSGCTAWKLAVCTYFFVGLVIHGEK
jgi:hypothetical protein